MQIYLQLVVFLFKTPSSTRLTYLLCPCFSSTNWMPRDSRALSDDYHGDQTHNHSNPVCFLQLRPCAPTITKQWELSERWNSAIDVYGNSWTSTFRIVNDFVVTTTPNIHNSFGSSFEEINARRQLYSRTPHYNTRYCYLLLKETYTYVPYPKRDILTLRRDRDEIRKEK